MRLLFLIVTWFAISFLSCCSLVQEQDTGKDNEEVLLPPIEVKALTDRTTATIADTITFTLTVSYDPDIPVKLPEVGNKIAGLRIVDFGEEGPKEVDTRIEHQKWYKLRPDIVGTYIIPSMTVSYKDTDGTDLEIKTPQIFIKVASSLENEEGEKSTDIIDIKPLQEFERDLRLFMIYGGFALVVLAVVIAVAFYLKRKKQGRQETIKPPHVLAFEEIEKLEQEKLIEKGVVKEHYFRLSEIFRRYIENRFHVPAVEQTTQELFPETKNLAGVSSSAKENTQNFLNYTDMVKFAKYAPTNDEVESNRTKAITVINETKKEETAPNDQTTEKK